MTKKALVLILYIFICAKDTYFKHGSKKVIFTVMIPGRLGGTAPLFQDQVKKKPTWDAIRVSGGHSLPKHLQNRKTCAETLIFVPKHLQNAVFSIPQSDSFLR